MAIKTTAKRPLPGGRSWGELFSMHVHDPDTSVLEIGLWDKGEDGAIPLSVTDVFRGPGGKELVGTARVPLSKVCPSPFVWPKIRRTPVAREPLHISVALFLALCIRVPRLSVFCPCFSVSLLSSLIRLPLSSPLFVSLVCLPC